MTSSIKQESYRKSIVFSAAAFCVAMAASSVQTLATSSQEVGNKQFIDNASTAAPLPVRAATGLTPAPVSTAPLSGPAVTGSVSEMAVDGHEDR
jgi:hypothetical protein